MILVLESPANSCCGAEELAPNCLWVNCDPEYVQLEWWKLVGGLLACVLPS